MDLNESLAAFRRLSYCSDLMHALRDKLNLPDNYAELEQQGKLTIAQQQALVVYRLLTQEAL